MTTTPRHPDHARLVELEAAESIGDLAHHEALELAELRQRVLRPSGPGADAVLGSLLAASVADEPRAIDGRLRSVIVAQGETVVGARRGAAGHSVMRRPWIGPLGWAGWAAAAVALASFVWQVATAPPPHRADHFEQLLHSPGKTVRSALAADPGVAEPYRAVAGEVVWSTDGQEGLVHAHGLPSNDPTKSRYQAWVVDASRPGSPPIDCGIFDASSGFVLNGERYIPIRAKLHVEKPVTFIITVEGPRGSVVASAGAMVCSAVIPPLPGSPDFVDPHWPPR